MDLRKIKKLIELLKESGIAEIEIHAGDESIRISRYVQPAPPSPGHTPEPPVSPEPGERAAVAARAAVPEPKPEGEGHVISAPMVGTFYRGPSPTSPPFVQVGQLVKRGEVVCIIEAMKVMNQIEADVDGVITAILVENGHPVEYGQPLLVLKRP